jgi:gamma-glutamyl phosphate reductase
MISRSLFIALGTVVMVGFLIYLRVSFQNADMKTALRLVEEAKIGTTTLGNAIEKVLPKGRRLCEALPISEFYGHMEVVCRNRENMDHQLRWQVNVVDGMVKPANEASVNLGKGRSPWQEKK